MSSDVPVQVVVAAFQDEGGADAALAQLRQAGKEHLIAIDQAVVVRKDQAGKVHIKRARGVGPGSGAIIGGVTGAVISILAGLSRAHSQELVAQLLVGSAKLLAERGDPARLRADVTSPGGTTAAGLRVLEEHGVRSAFLEAVMAATARSAELGRH